MAPDPGMVSVAIGAWAVAAAPSKMRTLLGSCVGVVLFDRAAGAGGLAHVVLPDSRGATDQPGKFADTAIPALIADLDRLLKGRSTGRLVAKLAGGARMFQAGASASSAALNIGELNRAAVEAALADRRIPVIARDLGGAGGRHIVFDPADGSVVVRTPGGPDRTI